jgi:hypothetical protein
MFGGALALGMEGIVAKDAASLYIEGPRVTSHWLKIKDKNVAKENRVSPATGCTLTVNRVLAHRPVLLDAITGNSRPSLDPIRLYQSATRQCNRRPR